MLVDELFKLSELITECENDFMKDSSFVEALFLSDHIIDVINKRIRNMILMKIRLVEGELRRMKNDN